MKIKLGRLFVATSLFVLDSGYGQDQNGLKAGRKERVLILGIGAATTTGEPYMNTPTINLIYMAMTSKYFGNHWEVAVGTGESYGGFAWQFDIWPLEFIRVGAGFGVIPFFDAMPGNPILIPLPEISAGCHFRSGALTYSGSATANLAYGARANMGLGYSF